MYRMISWSAAALIALCAAVGPAAADDRSMCRAENISQDNADDIIAACNRVLSRNPRSAEAYNARGFAYHHKGKNDLAIAEFDQAIRLDPKYFDPYSGRGFAYRAKDEYDRAIADLDQAIRLNPKNAYAYSGRGETYAAKGEYDRAIADLDQSIRLDPKNAVAYNGLGRVYKERGEYGRAIAAYDQALRLAPGDAVIRENRQLAANAADEADPCRKTSGDAAIAACTSVIARDPKNTAAYFNRANAYLDKGDYSRAVADYDQAQRLDPQHAEARRKRAVAQAALAAAEDVETCRRGTGFDAITSCGRVLYRDSKNAAAYVNRGDAYADKGDYERAIDDYNAALAINPADAVARRNRDRARTALAALAPQPPHQPPSPQVESAPSAVTASRRVALVIGMGAYANVTPLRNPIADARAVGAAFRRLGFAEVVEREDLTRAGMEQALKEFGDKAAEADWAVIYYAGHGVEMNGENYLVPVDAKLARADHVEDETVTLKRVLSKAEQARQIRMVILDACRNSPFRMASAEGRPRAVGRGLSASLEPVGGVMVAYAAKGGTVADDGDGEHSPFTQALLTHLETPNVDIRIMFSKVRDTVLARTRNAQEPFVYGSLPGEEFYFKGGAR